MATSNPEVFLVTSPGYTATKWIAWALNLHPEIYCNHYSEGEASDATYSCQELDTLLRNQEQYESYKGTMEFFDRLRGNAQSNGKSFGGNAGAYSATVLEKGYMREKPKNAPRTINILRHPIMWLFSGAYHIVKEIEALPTEQEEINEFMDGNQGEFRMLGVPKKPSRLDKAFCYMSGRMYHLVDEASFPWITHFRMEDITSDRDSFVEMVEHLTGLDVSHNGAYLDQVFSHGPIHQHNLQKARDPTEQFKRWQPWQQRVYAYDLHEYGIIEPYTEFGYDLSQVNVKTRA